MARQTSMFKLQIIRNYKFEDLILFLVFLKGKQSEENELVTKFAGITVS